MAGTAKPEASMLEASYVRTKGSLSAGDGSALFDGNTGVTGTYDYGYFYKAADHVVLNVSTAFKVWVYPCSSYPTYKAALAITRLAQDGVTWETVSGALPRAETGWSATTPVLPAGTYKFAYGSGARIDNEWFLERPSDTKTVVETANGALYGMSAGSFTSVGTTPCTEAVLDTYGMTPVDMSAVATSAWDALPAGSLVLHHKSKSLLVQTYCGILAQPRVVVQQTDYAMADWEAVTGVTLTATESKGGCVRVAVSVDSGTTWKTYADGTWQTLDITDVSAFTSSGLTPSSLSALSASVWAKLVPSAAFGMRFAYLLDPVVSGGVASVNTLTVTGNVKGAWVQDNAAKCGWLEGGARVQITAAGSYKINWPVL